jgi:ferritin-like metal-binding protein YciE
MGLFSKDIQSMEDLFLHTLQDIYYAENQIVKSLPKMIEKATNRNLSTGLRNHLRGQEPKGTDCPAIDGLIREADEVAGEVEDKKVLDAAIIGSAQAIEHYEISRYGTLIAWAQELEHGNIVSLLNANLREEKAADKKLSALAEGDLNRKAAGRRTAASATSPIRKTGSAKSARARKPALRSKSATSRKR